MAENLPTTTPPAPSTAEGPRGAASALGDATYEVIRQRLGAQGRVLRERTSQLNESRQAVFGSVESKLLQADRITTAHYCVPHDMIQLDHGRFLFGFNVNLGLKQEVELSDVFAIYHRDEGSGSFKEADLQSLRDKNFVTDFKRLYNVYAKASFTKFSFIDKALFMVFQTGQGDQRHRGLQMGFPGRCLEIRRWPGRK